MGAERVGLEGVLVDLPSRREAPSWGAEAPSSWERRYGWVGKESVKMPLRPAYLLGVGALVLRTACG